MRYKGPLASIGIAGCHLAVILVSDPIKSKPDDTRTTPVPGRATKPVARSQVVNAQLPEPAPSPPAIKVEVHMIPMTIEEMRVMATDAFGDEFEEALERHEAAIRVPRWGGHARGDAV
jgi:hypothetical protein